MFLGNKIRLKQFLSQGWLAVFLISSLWGCAERKHSNPLDPLNPETNGKPPRLHVVSDHHKVFLDWPVLALNSITGIRIYRSTDSSAVAKIASLPPLKKTFVDSHTVYNTTYDYSYSLVADGYESPPSEPQSITPGPSFFWVSLASIGQIIKLTFDVEHTYKRVTGSGFPAVMAFAGHGKGFWVADDYLGEIYRITNSGQLLFSVSGFGRITSIDCDTSRQVLWIADSRNKRVVAVDTFGYGKFAITGLEYPRQVRVNQKNGDCWIVDSGQNVLVQSDRSGTILRKIRNLTSPKWVSRTQIDGSIWAADSSSIVHISEEGTIESEISGFNDAYQVAVDPVRNTLFVLDQSYGWLGTELKKMGTDGTGGFSLRGFGFPKKIVVDPFDGSCVMADTYNYRVVKISTKGKITHEMKLEAAPLWITIEK